MSLSANAAAPPAAPPTVSDFAATQALIKEIASEATGAGKGLLFDPETGVDGAADPPESGASEGTHNEANEPAEDGEDPGQDGKEADGEEQGAEKDGAQASGEIDVGRVTKALKAEGGVDLAELAEALGVQPEALGMTQAQFKAARIERKKATKTLDRALALSQQLEKDFGDPVKARKAAAAGQLEPAIEYIESVFGMPWNDLNKMVLGLIQGKGAPDIESKREIQQLRKDKADRDAADRARTEEAAKQKQVDDAKAWIAHGIKDDPMVSEETNKALRDAGLPPLIDLVFEEMRAGYSKGLTKPKAALEKVKAKLAKQAKALQGAGVLPKTRAASSRPVSASPPRGSAQTGSAGNGRAMTDAELRRAVLKEAGLSK